jgi:hypothetical protein
MENYPAFQWQIGKFAVEVPPLRKPVYGKHARKFKFVALISFTFAMKLADEKITAIFFPVST